MANFLQRAGSTRKFSFLGVGSPLLDIVAEVEDAFLAARIPGEKGGMQMVEASFQEEVIANLPGRPRLVPGGAAGNTVFALARLGVDVAMLGKLGTDENGDFYRRRFRELGGSDRVFIKTDKAPTGTCLSLITPDAERTMRSYLGASLLLTPDEIFSVNFAEFDFVYLEGFMFYSKVIPALLRRAKDAGCKIGLDLASFEVVRDFKAKFPVLLEEYIDIVIGNELEIAALFGADTSPEKALEMLSKSCEVAAVKLGRKGAVIRRGRECVSVPALLVENPLDTTAAGDLWTAGFLYGLIEGKDLAEAGRYGALLSREVVQVYGSEFGDEAWGRVKAAMGRA